MIKDWESKYKALEASLTLRERELMGASGLAADYGRVWRERGSNNTSLYVEVSSEIFDEGYILYLRAASGEVIRREAKIMELISPTHEDLDPRVVLASINRLIQLLSLVGSSRKTSKFFKEISKLCWNVLKGGLELLKSESSFMERD